MTGNRFVLPAEKPIRIARTGVFYLDSSQYGNAKSIKDILGETNMGTRLILIIAWLLIVNCMEEPMEDQSEGCLPCISLALKIRIEDSFTKAPVINASITATNNHPDTLFCCDSAWHWSDIDSTYQIPGLPGIYKISFSHPEYDSFVIDNIIVTQWDKATCKFANTNNLIIEVDKTAPAKKAGSTGYTLKNQFEEGHCM